MLTFSNIERAGSLKSIKPYIHQVETHNYNDLEGLGRLCAFGFLGATVAMTKQNSPKRV
jgi:hypothetical protein